MRPTVFFLITLAFANILFAQTNIHPNHNHTVPDLIDGALHPELIPDATAYRLYFVAVSEMPNPTEEQKARQTAHLRRMRLTDNDMQSTIIALEEFKVQYTNLIALYNESAKAADVAGRKPDFDTFRLQRDALVQRTRERVKSVLTPDGLARFDGHIQDEKRNMKVSSKEGQ